MVFVCDELAVLLGACSSNYLQTLTDFCVAREFHVCTGFVFPHQSIGFLSPCFIHARCGIDVVELDGIVDLIALVGMDIGINFALRLEAPCNFLRRRQGKTFFVHFACLDHHRFGQWTLP